MQQLTQWQRQDNLLVSKGCPIDDIDGFEALSCSLAKMNGWQVLTMDRGADRAQLQFRFEQEDFLLHYEALCDSLWIEPLTHLAYLKIQNLIK